MASRTFTVPALPPADRGGQVASDFLAARLVYRLIGLALRLGAQGGADAVQPAAASDATRHPARA